MSQKNYKPLIGIAVLIVLFWFAAPSLARTLQPSAEVGQEPGSPFAAAPEAALSSTMLNPDADTQVSSADGDANYGSDATMTVGNLYSTSTYRTFAHFDLSSIPDDALVQEAALRLHRYTTYGSNDYDIEVYRAQAAWDEDTLTWNNQPTMTATGITTTVDSIAYWFEWDVAALVQDWVDSGNNHGLALRAVDENFEAAHVFDTREGTDPPQLVITYTLPNLTVDFFEYDGATIVPGVPIGDQVTLRVRNDGLAPVPTGYFIGFYISPDETITTGDTLLSGGREFGPALDVGQVATVNLASSSYAPTDYPEGPAFLGVILDEFDVIGESDEGDNTAAQSVLVLPPGSPTPTPEPSCDPVPPEDPPMTWVVDSVMDNLYPVTLRCALTQARAGDTIQFDPVVFPPGAPASIVLTEALPQITQGNLILNGSGAGVILDGSGLPPNTPGLMLFSNENTVTGLQILNMTGYGIVLQGDSNTIGSASNPRATFAVSNVAGPPASPANVIGANGASGILIQGDGNTVQGNYIGTDASGMLANSNSSSGIYLSSGVQNQIGGSGAGEGNLMGGNTGSGIVITSDRSHDNRVLGNFIGVDKDGDDALPNTGIAGVRVFNGAQSNQIGGANNGEGNLISGNDGSGVLLRGQDVRDNLVLGNTFGLDAAASAPLGNFYGVELLNGPQQNRVGGEVAGEANVISGNDSHGVFIRGNDTADNTIQRNFIGTNETGLPDYLLGNGGAGVFITQGAHDNVIGDAGGNGNVIVQNHSVGVAINGANKNQVVSNRIGQTDDGTPLGNFDHGVFIYDGSPDNRVTKNRITANQGDGIRVDGSGSLGNTISQNSIYDNDGMGIENVNGGNLELAPPQVTGLDDLGGGKWKISGTTCPNCTVEVFSDDGAEGECFEVNAQANGAGAFVVNNVTRKRNYFALTVTDNAGDTSEFGATDDLEIFAIEATQAIQSLDNDVVLIADKRTYVRVHVRSSLSEAPMVAAQLTGERNGVPLGALAPTGSGCDPFITVQPDPDRAELNHSFCFELPPGWITAGDLTLDAEVNPGRLAPETDYGNNTAAAVVTFEQSPQLTVKIFTVNYREGMRLWRNFDGGYTENDGAATGDVDGDGSDEILIASDNNGIVDVWGLLVASNAITIETWFDGDFTESDAFAVGNVIPDAGASLDEILVADDGSGWVDVFQWDGAAYVNVGDFDGDFTESDAFAVGNVIPDAGASLDEILVASDGGRVDVFQWNGATWVNAGDFDGDFTESDALAVGNVISEAGATLDEILIAGDLSGRVDVFQWNGADWGPPRSFLGNPNLMPGGFAVGDVDYDAAVGDRLAEILIAGGDVCKCAEVFKWDAGADTWIPLTMFDGFSSDQRVFTENGGFVVGDVDGNGRAEAITARADNQEVQIYQKAGPGDWREIVTPAYHTEYLKSYLRRVFPIAQLNVAPDVLEFPPGLGTPDSGEVNALLIEMHDEEGADDQVRYYGLVSDEAGSMQGAALDIPSPVASGPTGTPGGHLAWDTDASYGDWYGAHELGHALDQSHAEFCDAKRGKDDPRPPYPYPDGFIGGPEGAEERFYGFDVGDAALALPLDIHPGSSWYDVMTYCHPNEWLSDFTYEGIRDNLINPPAAREAQQSGDFLFFAGRMNLTQATGRINTMYVHSGASSTSLPTSSLVTLRLEGSGGNILAEHLLNLYYDSDAIEGEDEVAMLYDVVPYPAGTALISFWHKGSVVMSRTVSPNPPAVTLAYPNGGETLTGDTVTVEWQASDADGDELHYTVLYSADGGNTWDVLVMKWAETSYVVDTARLPGSTAGRFRVIANDGANRGQDDSDGDVTVPFRPPLAAIDWPLDGGSFISEQTIILRGSASDPDGLPISGYSWTSSLDGALGNGPVITVTGLSTGVHTITLTATDSGALTGEDSIQLTVVETWSPPSPPNMIYLPFVLR